MRTYIDKFVHITHFFKTMTSIKRLKKEYDALKDPSNKDPTIVLEPSPESLMTWTATITAPPDSVYAGYSFKLAINVPQQYPIIPPSIRFITKIFHPNVQFSNGESTCLYLFYSVVR